MTVKAEDRPSGSAGDSASVITFLFRFQSGLVEWRVLVAAARSAGALVSRLSHIFMDTINLICLVAMIQVLSTNWDTASFLLIILSKCAKINQKISRGRRGMKNKEIMVLDQAIHINKDDYFSLTDIARYKNSEEPRFVIQNWMRRIDTIQYLGLWEQLNNPSFNRVEFDTFRSEAGHNYFTMTPKKWIEGVNAIGIVSKAGKYNSGTYAHKDIALQFASWISPEINLYIIKEFQRLKAEEQKQLDWSVKRELAKINYRIHTDAIKDNIIIPREISKEQTAFVYASEADVLNVALFGMTAKQWRDKNPDKKGNIRDYAEVSQLICLSNLENLNAYLIERGVSQSERLLELNRAAIRQMKVLAEERSRLLDDNGEE